MSSTIPPLSPRPDVLDFLRSRRSRPAKTLTTPVPNRDQLMALLSLAARTPDHGKLEPWRFIVLQKQPLGKLATLVAERATALDIAPDKRDKAIAQYANADLAVAVVFTPKPSDKVPQIEQLYSAGAVCLSLLNAALASGWGANWLSGWASHDDIFARDGLGLEANEKIAGLIHIGTETLAPPERPRPDVGSITTWAG